MLTEHIRNAVNKNFNDNGRKSFWPGKNMNITAINTAQNDIKLPRKI